MINKIERFLVKFIEKLEGQKISVYTWFFCFFGIVFLRNFFESFSTNSELISSSHWGFFFLHSTAYYLCVILCVSLVIYLFTKEKIEKITKLVLFGSFFIILVPIFDLIFIFFSKTQTIPISYIFFEPSTTPIEIFSYIKNFVIWGIPGLFLNDISGNLLSKLNIFSFLRIAIFFIDLFILKWIFSKTKSPLRAILFASTIFVLINLTLFLVLFSNIPNDFFKQLSFCFGSKISSIIVGFLILFYVLFKSKSVFKGLLVIIFLSVPASIFTIFPYFFIILFKTPLTPRALYNVSALNPSFEWNSIIFSLYFIIVFVLSFFWFLAYNKKKFIAILKNLRLASFLHNIAMLGLGLYVAIISKYGHSDVGLGIIPPNLHFRFFDFILIAIACISIFLYWLSGVGYDDSYDENVDKISNPNRPLPQGNISKEEFSVVNNILRGASFICAAAISYSFFIFILLRSVVAYFYFTPPFRFKRFPIIATFLMSLGALMTVLAGFSIVSENKILDFPGSIMIFIIVVFTFGLTIKDIKDYEGDKAGGIYTIPVIFGLKKGKIIIGILVSFISFLPIILFPQNSKALILSSICISIVGFLLINRKKYDPKPFIVIYFFYGAFLFFSLFSKIF